jgi:GPH family glycoside/pentoside/hexuronide:cation symporter
MLADVVDFDELEGGRRREGAFTSILSYVLKFGTTLTLLITGPVIELTGFDAHKVLQDPGTIRGLRILFAVVPATAALLAAIALRRYPLTRARMNTIRARLEARRGAV